MARLPLVSYLRVVNPVWNKLKRNKGWKQQKIPRMDAPVYLVSGDEIVNLEGINFSFR